MIDNKTLVTIAWEVKNRANDIIFDIPQGHETNIDLDIEGNIYVISYKIYYKESYSRDEDRFYNPYDRELTSIEITDAYYFVGLDDDNIFLSQEEKEHIEKQI